MTRTMTRDVLSSNAAAIFMSPRSHAVARGLIPGTPPSAADLLVTSRLHGVILAVVAGTTVIAVSVASKVNAVMADVDLAEYCLEAATFDADGLFALSMRALRHRGDLERQVRERASRIAATLPAAYDALATLLGPRVVAQCQAS